MKDEPHSPVRPAHHAAPHHTSFTPMHTPVLLPIAAPGALPHRGGVIPSLAASLGIMIVLGVAALGLVGARQDLAEGRSARVERPVTP